MRHEERLGLLVGALASVRYAFIGLRQLLVLSALLVAIAVCVNNVGLWSVPFMGAYLSKVPIDAAITLLGILIAASSALSVWRQQKKDDLLASVANEVSAFFDSSLGDATSLNSYLVLLEKLRREVMLGPCSLESVWRASHLAAQSHEMREAAKALKASAIRVHSLDGRNVQALTFHRTVFRSFKSAKTALIELADTLPIIPPRYEDPGDLICWLRFVSEGEFDAFLSSFDALSARVAGGAGGVKGGVYARFFPPTLTFAGAIFRASREG